MYCQNCGKETDETPCPYCGFETRKHLRFPIIGEREGATEGHVRQAAPPSPAAQPTVIIQNTTVVNGFPGASRKSKLVALLLCIFLGIFGIHRFYVGKTGSGVLYLCTAGICGIGWIFDLCAICLGRFRDANGLPLR